VIATNAGLIGISRLSYSLASNDLFPGAFARLHPRFRTPHVTSLITGVVVAIASGFTPIGVLGQMVSIGTLMAFVIVALLAAANFGVAVGFLTVAVLNGFPGIDLESYASSGSFRVSDVAVALLVALYTVAAHESRIRALIATGLLGAGSVMAAARWQLAGTVPRSLLFLSAMVVAALFAGLTAASGSRYLAWMDERARRLETERDQQAVIAAAATVKRANTASTLLR